MKCPVCGVDNLDGSAYCDDCGSKLPTAGVTPPSSPAEPEVVSASPVTPELGGGTVICPSCNYENPAGDSFCSDCGASLKDIPSVVSPLAHGETSSGPRAKLIEKKSLREFPITSDVTILGRQSPADNIFPDIDMTDIDTDSYVSRRHLQIIKQGEQYFVEDLGSSNGSFLNNGPRLNPGVQSPINNGERLQLGQTEFTFVIS